jgi:preprotein translocase subunit Sss1
MELDPRQVPIIIAIGIGICVGLVGYLAYVLISILATA